MGGRRRGEGEGRMGGHTERTVRKRVSKAGADERGKIVIGVDSCTHTGVYALEYKQIPTSNCKCN